jgi:Fe-S oxidoreductase
LVQKTLQSIQKKGNSLGDSKRKRPAWTKKLDFTIKDARKEPVDVLWWVGDYASLDPRSQKVSIAFAQLLNKAGVDFGILYEGEMTAGNDVRRVGEEGLYVHLAESNIELLNSCEFKQMVTTDPHTYNTIRNEYPEFGGEYQIEHASAMVKRLIDSGEIQLDRKLDYRVTYHDPCHLGRYNKGYEPPRDAIQLIGCELIEMPRNRDNSFCCGAGGGRIWTADPIELQKPSQNRAEEAAEIDGLNCLVVSCPKCMTMMEDGMKTTGNEGKWEVKDMIELVSECVDFGGPEAEAAETVEEAGA